MVRRTRDRSQALSHPPARSPSGRNTARATVGGEFPTGALSIAPRVPRSTIAHVSASPPLIPDSRISRVRLAAAACPRRTFPRIARLKRSPAYTPAMRGYTSGSTRVEVDPGTWHCVQPAAFIACPPLTESPFARKRRYLFRGGVQHRLSRRYPAFIAPTGSCATPNPSCGFGGSPLYRRSLQVAASPCWQWVFPDVISAILAWVLGPVPRSAPLVLSPVSSQRTSASR